MEPLPDPRSLASPIVNERRPDYPIRWELPSGAFRYKVKDGDTWETVARTFQVKSARYLMFFNFYVVVDRRKQHTTNEVNWYLRNYVGCNVSTDGRRNWAFSDSAKPGVIFIPTRTIDFEGDGLVIVGSKGVGDEISVPQYDDSNILDTLGKALDVYGAVDLGIGVSELALPALLEGGLIFSGAAASVVGPLVAVGGPHMEALQKRNRDNFFGGFADGLVMSANGASSSYIKERREWRYAPHETQYPEKAETFRKLHNAGLELGIRKGRMFNTVDRERFFTSLHAQMSQDDKDYYSPRIPWKDWSEDKKKQYYDLLSSMVRRTMLSHGLKFKLHS
ncbi:hypothetical protein [Alsobacter sp. SYSU BS001988]